MKPGLEEWFNEETAEFFNKSIPYAVRHIKWKRLIQAQEGVVRIQRDGSITSPIDKEEIRDANEYLLTFKKSQSHALPLSPARAGCRVRMSLLSFDHGQNYRVRNPGSSELLQCLDRAVESTRASLHLGRDHIRRVLNGSLQKLAASEYGST